MKNPRIDIRKLKKAVRISKSFREVAEYFNNIRSHQYIAQLIKKNNLNFSHFKLADRSIYIGQTFNDLTIKKIYRTETKPKRIMCVCSCACGATSEKITRLEAVLNGRVISCGCASKSRKTMRGNGNPAFRGVGKIGAAYFNSVIKAGAKKRSIPFNLTIEYLWELFLKQEEKCALTGKPLWFGRHAWSHETSASLDRIDSTKGYVEGNVQWVLKDINRMKWGFNVDHFIKLCHLVSKYDRQKKKRAHDKYKN